VLGKKVFVAAVFCMSWMLLWGCAPPLALQGLSSAAPVAFTPGGSGKGDSAWLARYDDVVEATRLAAQVLALEVTQTQIGEDQTAFIFVDGRGNKLNILIERRTDTVTYARMSVGWFGSRTVGQLLARQIIFELNRDGKFLRNLEPVEVD